MEFAWGLGEIARESGAPVLKTLFVRTSCAQSIIIARARRILRCANPSPALVGEGGDIGRRETPVSRRVHRAGEGRRNSHGPHPNPCMGFPLSRGKMRSRRGGLGARFVWAFLRLAAMPTDWLWKTTG